MLAKGKIEQNSFLIQCRLVDAEIKTAIKKEQNTYETVARQFGAFVGQKKKNDALSSGIKMCEANRKIFILSEIGKSINVLKENVAFLVKGELNSPVLEYSLYVICGCAEASGLASLAKFKTTLMKPLIVKFQQFCDPSNLKEPLNVFITNAKPSENEIMDNMISASKQHVKDQSQFEAMFNTAPAPQVIPIQPIKPQLPKTSDSNEKSSSQIPKQVPETPSKYVYKEHATLFTPINLPNIDKSKWASVLASIKGINV